MGVGQKETISNDQGLTTEGQKSGSLGNTDSSNGNSPIEKDKTYLLNSKTGETISGLELQRLANQGKMSRSLQSQLDKTTAEHKSALDRLAQLERERETLVVKATLADTYMAGKPTQQTSDEESDDDFSSIWEDENEGKKTVTKPALRNRNENSSIPNEFVNDLKTVKSEIQEIRAERQKISDQTELEKIARYDSEQNFVTMKNDLPDIADNELRQIVLSENTAEKLRIDAMNKRLDGDQSWADDLAESRQILAKARKNYVDAVKRQEVISIQKDDDMSTEAGVQVTGGISVPEGFKFSTNPEKAQEQWKEISDQNRKKSQLRRRTIL